MRHRNIEESMRITPTHTTFSWTAAIATSVGLASTLLAAPDDFEQTLTPQQVDPRVQQARVIERNFDQWVFQGVGTPESGKERMQQQLQAQLDELVAICDITEDQKEKLTLAATGDMKRFFGQLDDIKRQFRGNPENAKDVGLAWQQAQPMQFKLASGLFDNDSLFYKTVKQTLSPEQSEQFAARNQDRRDYRYRACIESSIVTLEDAVPLTGEQRQALIQLLIENSEPPKIFGNYNYNLVMYRMGTLPEEKLKPLFQEHQWKQIDMLCKQFRGMEHFLITNGIIEKETP